ncbi:hypothetical protein BC936DRAFT_138854, partial [Jimgerdemannia flammicorona]
MADILTIYNQYELMYTLAASSPKKHDLMKHAEDLYTLYHNLRDMLDELREHHCLQGRDPLYLYILGIQVYQLHLIKNVDFLLYFNCYGFLKVAICITWNVQFLTAIPMQAMVNHLVEDLKKAKDLTWMSFSRPKILEKLLTPDTPSKTQ